MGKAQRSGRPWPGWEPQAVSGVRKALRRGLPSGNRLGSGDFPRGSCRCSVRAVWQCVSKELPLCEVSCPRPGCTLLICKVSGPCEPSCGPLLTPHPALLVLEMPRAQQWPLEARSWLCPYSSPSVLLCAGRALCTYSVTATLRDVESPMQSSVSGCQAGAVGPQRWAQDAGFWWDSTTA